MGVIAVDSTSKERYRARIENRERCCGYWAMTICDVLEI